MKVERQVPRIAVPVQFQANAEKKDKAKDSFIWVEKPTVPNSLETKSPTLFACICDGEKGGCGCHGCNHDGKRA